MKRIIKFLDETFIRFKKRNSDAEFKIDKLYNILESVNPPFNYEDNDLEIRIADENGGSRIESYILFNRVSSVVGFSNFSSSISRK